MQVPDHFSTLLVELSELFSAQLRTELPDMPAQRADRVALVLIERVQQQFGGLQVYIPSGSQLRERRRQLMLADYDAGMSCRQVATKYSVSLKLVYSVVKPSIRSKIP